MKNGYAIIIVRLDNGRATIDYNLRGELSQETVDTILDCRNGGEPYTEDLTVTPLPGAELKEWGKS